MITTIQSVREVELKSLHGRKIAIDASMAIYQFLIAVRAGGPNQQSFQLTNDKGETTSHIQGMFNRTVRYMQEGIKPVFVFDGKPPQLKSGELVKRREKREKAQAALKVAAEEGDADEHNKQSKRLVRAGQKENDDCQRLLRLMGVPVVLAPCEAEAQAAALAKNGAVYATATEDMDALTFQTPVLLRKMNFVSGNKPTIQSMNYAKAVEGLGLTHAQFVDLCILLGCDYCDTIKGVGPKTALKLIREHGCIEKILENIDKKKYAVPETWMPAGKTEESEDTENDEEEELEPPIAAYVQARKLFNEHEVLETVELKWKPCQAEELKKFLVDEMGFNPDRVDSSITKLQQAHKANSKPQTRMDAFFKVKAGSSSTKRKAPPPAAKGKGKVAASKKKK